MSPYLSPAERAQFIGPRGRCSTCGDVCIRQYCRSCDEFFNECHCPTRPHVGHRTYRWIDGVIVADPNFDQAHAVWNVSTWHGGAETDSRDFATEAEAQAYAAYLRAALAARGWPHRVIVALVIPVAPLNSA